MLTQGYVINLYNKVSVQFYNVLWYYNYILRLGRNEQRKQQNSILNHSPL